MKTGFVHSLSCLTVLHPMTRSTVLYCTLNPGKFQECFTQWVQSAFPDALTIPDDETHVVPVDGRTVRGSRGKGKRAVHIVSVWSSKLSLVIGETKVDKKSNEMTAIRGLLETIDLKGCLITADVMSCQKGLLVL